MSEETFDLNALEPIFSEFSAQRGALIPVLQRAQELYGYLPAPVLTRISERMHVSLSQVYGVATFYAQFYLTRRGRNIVRQCDGTACHVRGAAKIITAVENELGIKAGRPRLTIGSRTKSFIALVRAGWRRWPRSTTRLWASCCPKECSRSRGP